VAIRSKPKPEPAERETSAKLLTRILNGFTFVISASSAHYQTMTTN